MACIPPSGKYTPSTESMYVITAYSDSASYGASPAYIAWKLKMRCKRSSRKKLAILLSSLRNAPIFTSDSAAFHGLMRSSGELKLTSMNDDISAAYNFSNHAQKRIKLSPSRASAKRVISAAISSRPWRTISSLPSAYTARYIGSTFLIVTYDAMSAPAALNASSSRFGIVSTVGPLSRRNPCASMIPARPPGWASRSTTVTSCP